jgi:hypothetical protein
VMDWRQWPGMRGVGSATTWRFRCERGIWGKVHGAESDYRWIAASPGFSGGRGQFYAELSVGQPTAPEKFSLWRSYGGRFYAVSCYPSRARDAVGRSGFLERQVLEWEPAPDTPPALAALALLPAVTSFNDMDWWDHSDDPRWGRSEFALPIEPLDYEVTAEEIGPRVEAGLRRLRELPEETARRFWTELAAKCERPEHYPPALLPDQSAPLPALALAGLLLPIDPDTGARLSLAAWIPSNLATAADFRVWDGVAAGKRFWNSPEPLRAEAELGSAWNLAIAADESEAEALRAYGPEAGKPVLAREPEEERPLPAEAARLLEFAHSRDRWLSAKSASFPAGPVAVTRSQREILVQAARDLFESANEGPMPEYLSHASIKVQSAYQLHLIMKAWVYQAALELAFGFDPTEQHVHKIWNIWAQEGNAFARQRLRTK